MQRRRWLVAYDIRHPKRLRLVRRTMKGFGMPFQYSVFLCDLTSAERFDLLQALMDVINKDFDRVALVDLGPVDDPAELVFLGPRSNIPGFGPTVL